MRCNRLASKRDSSTIATASKQCQTSKPLKNRHPNQLSSLAFPSKCCFPHNNGSGSATRPDLLLCEAMDYLWTPWRYAYVSAAGKISGCVFCDLPKEGDDEKVRIVHRGQ